MVTNRLRVVRACERNCVSACEAMVVGGNADVVANDNVLRAFGIEIGGS